MVGPPSSIDQPPAFAGGALESGPPRGREVGAQRFYSALRDDETHSCDRCAQPDNEFIAEDARLFYIDLPGYGSPAHALTFGIALVPGENLSIGPLSTATMDFRSRRRPLRSSSPCPDLRGDTVSLSDAILTRVGVRAIRCP